MKIYNYDAVTKAYMGEGFADESPLEAGVWLIPAHATAITPLEAQQNKIRCFVDGAWVYKDIPEPQAETDTSISGTKQSLTDEIIANPTELAKLKAALGV